MKKYIFLLITLVCSVALHAQIPRQPDRSVEVVDDGVIVTYTFTDKRIFTSQYYPNSSYWCYQGFGINDTPGEPGVPFRNDSFVVPLESNVSVEVIDSAFEDTTFVLSPALPIILENDSLIRLCNISPYHGFFPATIMESDNVKQYRDVGVLKVCICPVQYDYEHTIVRKYSFIRYKVTYDNQMMNTKSPILKNITLNCPLIKTLTQESREADVASTSDDRGLLIVTTNDYMAALDSFILWKKIKGYRVYVETKNKGEWTNMLVKQKISYHLTEHQIQYVLILGGVNDVPTNQETINVYDDEGYYILNCASDYKYGLPDINGEVPQVFRGRIPVDSISELRPILNKIIQYEREPVINNFFYKKGINCGYFQSTENQYNNSYTGYEERCFVMTSENVREHLRQNYNKTIDMFYTKEPECYPTHWNNDIFSDGGLIPTDSINWYGNSSDIKNSINDGAHYILYRGHGEIDSWYSIGFTNQHIDSLSNNKKMPLVFSLTCHTGAYYQTGDCFAERFLKKEEGGCVGIFAATNSGISGYNDAILLGMFDAIYPGLTPVHHFNNYDSYTQITVPSYTQGEILDIGLRRMSETFGRKDSNIKKYMYYLCHYFGDPTMEIWTDTPQMIDNPMVVRTKDSIFVQVNDGEARITLYYPALDNSLSVPSVYSYVGTELSCALEDDNVIVCIDRHNCLPYVVENGDIIFLQNDTISGNRTISGKRIIAGRNVTDKRASGKVVFDGGGTVAIKGKERVELHPGTEIKVGTKVIINKQGE